MQFPITPGPTYPETLSETPPGIIGNCICQGIAFGGESEYRVYNSTYFRAQAKVRLGRLLALSKTLSYLAKASQKQTPSN